MGVGRPDVPHWTEAGLQRITLHECRHTFASMPMAAGYTINLRATLVDCRVFGTLHARGGGQDGDQTERNSRELGEAQT